MVQLHKSDSRNQPNGGCMTDPVQFINLEKGVVKFFQFVSSATCLEYIASDFNPRHQLHLRLVRQARRHRPSYLAGHENRKARRHVDRCMTPMVKAVDVVARIAARRFRRTRWTGHLQLIFRRHAPTIRYSLIAGFSPVSEAEMKMLVQAGEALFGPRWQSDTARVLGFDDPARLRRIIAGDRPFPPEGWKKLAAELRRRAHNAEALAIKIVKM